MDGIVPLAVEHVASDVEGVHLLGGDGNSLGILRAVEFVFYRQAGLRCGCSDQIDDDALADQRRRCPIDRDEREQPVFYLVSLLVPGGRWRTTMSMPISEARRCSSTFYSRQREALLPPPSAVMVNCVAEG